MKRTKTIKYIADTSVGAMIQDVIDNRRDIDQVIQIALDSRKEYGLKVQEFIEKLKKGND